MSLQVNSKIISKKDRITALILDRNLEKIIFKLKI